VNNLTRNNTMKKLKKMSAKQLFRRMEDGYVCREDMLIDGKEHLKGEYVDDRYKYVLGSFNIAVDDSGEKLNAVGIITS